uniref:Phytanoyl-CoA dioxygenase domain-containing protein 1 n=2 Tax=Cyprinus carpio TaxID=7962 RepID=A0A8C1P8W3_CYPCA
LRIFSPKHLKKSNVVVVQYRDEGYLVLDGLLSPEECDALRDRMSEITEQMDVPEHCRTQFSTDHDEQLKKQGNADYFITSGDKIRFFFEKGVFDDKGEFIVPKEHSLNKIGHALHAYEPLFKAVTHSPKVQVMTEPSCKQMDIVPVTTGFVTNQECVCVALFVCVLDGITRQMVRTPKGTFPLTDFIGREKIHDDKLFIPVPVKKGGAVLIHGEVVHRSAANTSDASRHVYTFHIMESQNTIWSPENWLQPTEELPFPSLYT